MGGGNIEGIFSVIPWSWDERPPYKTPVRWHTGDLETDPWEWRMRVLDERKDIAYASCFLEKGGMLPKNGPRIFLRPVGAMRTLSKHTWTALTAIMPDSFTIAS